MMKPALMKLFLDMIKGGNQGNEDIRKGLHDKKSAQELEECTDGEELVWKTQQYCYNHPSRSRQYLALQGLIKGGWVVVVGGVGGWSWFVRRVLTCCCCSSFLVLLSSFLVLLFFVPRSVFCLPLSSSLSSSLPSRHCRVELRTRPILPNHCRRESRRRDRQHVLPHVRASLPCFHQRRVVATGRVAR